MNFGLLIDNTSRDSFEIRDGRAYLLGTSTPHTTKHSIDNRSNMSIFQYPFLFDNSGYFINLKKTKLPDIDFDIIFLVREIYYDKFTIEAIRKKYPNAMVFGVLKEQYIQDEGRRCHALSQSDKVLLPFAHKYLHYFYEKYTGHKPIWLPQPYDIEFLNTKFYKEVRNCDIFSYVSVTLPNLRRANTEAFTNYIAEKYNLSVKRITTANWSDFMEEVSSCRFLFNLDPIQAAGQTGIQSAILGVPGIGAHSDSNHHLFPLTNGINFDQLEEGFCKLFFDTEAYLEYAQNAYNNVHKIYGMSSVKQKIMDLYNEG